MLLDFNLRVASLRLQDRKSGGDGDSVGGLLNKKSISVHVRGVAVGVNPTVNDAGTNKTHDFPLQLRIRYRLSLFNLVGHAPADKQASIVMERIGGHDSNHVAR